MQTESPAGAASVMQLQPWATPWRVLVQPVLTLRDLHGYRHWLSAVATNAILLLASGIASASALEDIAVTAGIARGDLPPVVSFVLMILQSALVAFSLAALLAIALMLLAGLTATKVDFPSGLVLAGHGLMPFYLGLLMGSLQLLFVQPLTTDALLILEYQLKPFSLGLATFMPAAFPPASLHWFIASYGDLYGCWAVLLFALGIRHCWRRSTGETAWLTIGLVLVLLAVITALWQVVQRSLVAGLG